MSGRGARAARAASRAVLTMAIRGRRANGGPWGEAVLAEFDQTAGGWESVRWATGGLRVAWRERRQRIRRLSRPARYARRAGFAVAFLVVAAVPVSQYVLSPSYQPSASMSPTIRPGHRFLLDRVAFRVTGVERGDVVVYRPSGLRQLAGQGSEVKRVIGLPGDHIECRDGRVVRNGTVLDEPYLSPDPSGTVCESVTVPEDAYYVLGDRRAVSIDSRQDGTVPAAAIVGRVVAIW